MEKITISSYLQIIIIIVFLFLCSFIPVHFALTLPDSAPFTYSGHTDIEISNVIHSINHRQKRSSPNLPESFNLTFTITDNPIRFSLKRNRQLTNQVPVYLARHESIEFHHDKEQVNEAFYQDPAYTASVHVECKTKWGSLCKDYEIFASFITRGEHFILHKVLTNSSRNSLSGKYRIVKPVTDYSLRSDYRIPDGVNLKNILETSKHRYKRQVTGNFEVELLIVTDYSVYKYWYDSSSSTTDAQKQADARRNINIYIAFLLNGVDVRYQNLPGATYTIKVVYAGLLITETQLASRWTEDRKTANNPLLVPADGVLDAFSVWVNAQKATLPAHDHAMLITRYDLHKNFATGTTGYATLSAMCKAQSQSIVEEKFNFISHTVAAHELGHSLGAIHDGEQNSCNGSARFIMASTSSALTGSIAHHPWEFSACTTSEINTYIQTLSSNCMLIKNSALDQGALNVYLTPKIGQSYTVDQQCEKLGGTGSYLCVGQYNGNFESICTGIWCSSPTNANLCTLYLPGEGTTCGNKKWCVSGVCTASSSAPAADDACLFGDDRGIVVNSLTCQQMMSQNPSFCYDQQIRSKCCQSCKQNYDPSYPDCLYGDRGDCSSLTGAFQCYSNAQLCCRTCAQYETGIPGCQFGDQPNGCIKTNCPFYTSTQKQLCCATCYDGTTTVRTTPTTTTPTTTPSTTTVVSPQTTATTKVQPDVTVPTSSVSATSKVTIAITTPSVVTTTVTEELQSWLVPLIGAGAGVVFIIVVVIVCWCMCRSARKKPTRHPSSIRRSTASRGFTNPNTPYIIAEENGYLVSKPPPQGFPEENGYLVSKPPPQGFSYTALTFPNGQANQPAVPQGTRPKIALKPPANKRPVGPQRSISVDRGTVVKSAPPPPRTNNNNKPIVPEKTFLYHDGKQGEPTVNYGYNHGY